MIVALTVTTYRVDKSLFRPLKMVVVVNVSLRHSGVPVVVLMFALVGDLDGRQAQWALADYGNTITSPASDLFAYDASQIPAATRFSLRMFRTSPVVASCAYTPDSRL